MGDICALPIQFGQQSSSQSRHSWPLEVVLLFHSVNYDKVYIVNLCGDRNRLSQCIWEL